MGSDVRRRWKDGSCSWGDSRCGLTSEDTENSEDSLCIAQGHTSGPSNWLTRLKATCSASAYRCGSASGSTFFSCLQATASEMDSGRIDLVELVHNACRHSRAAWSTAFYGALAALCSIANFWTLAHEKKLSAAAA